MWKLTIEDDEQKQTSLPLVHEEYGVGRAEGNVIRLTDRNVSRKHAILRRGGPGWIVKDLESYNGTYVNGLRVAGEAKVVHGDVVQLGDYRLEFNDEAKSVEAEAARTSVDSNARPPHQRPDRLVVVVGPTPGQEFPLVGDHFTMGRAEDASISINHSSVSRFHAEIFALGTGRYEIIDKGSANGIRVNGHDLKRGIFEAGDAIELGDVRLRFVGAGKIFRAGGFDHRQQIAAVKAFDPAIPGSLRPGAVAASKSQSSGLGKWIAIGVGLGLLGVVGALIVLRTGVTETVPPTAPSDKAPAADPGTAILKDAIALSEKKEHEAAHKKVLSIPESSAARNDPKFAEVEARWADWMFEKVEKSTDPAEKRTLLHEIATTQTVDAARRKKAANMIQEMDPTAPDPSASASSSAGPPGSGAVPPDAPPGDPAPGGPTPGGPTPPGPGKPPDPAPSASVDPRDQALKAPEATMNALIKKMSAGTATEQELRLLRGLCAQLGNRSCWSAASAALKNLENK